MFFSTEVGSNDFPRAARNQRDADAFSLQHLESASLLPDRYRAQPEGALHHSLETRFKVYVSGKQERALQ